MHPETADEGTDIRQFVRNCPPTSSTTSGDPEQNGNGLSSVSAQAGLDFLKEACFQMSALQYFNNCTGYFKFPEST